MIFLYGLFIKNKIASLIEFGLFNGTNKPDLPCSTISLQPGTSVVIIAHSIDTRFQLRTQKFLLFLKVILITTIFMQVIKFKKIALCSKIHEIYHRFKC